MTDSHKLKCKACEEGPGVVAHLLTIASLLMVAASLPLSLFMVVKVVQVQKCLLINLTKKCYY